MIEAYNELKTKAEDKGIEYRSTAPLYELVGMLDNEEADRLWERSREFREEFDEQVDKTVGNFRVSAIG